MESLSDLKFHLDGKEDAKKLFYMYENVLMKGRTDEEKANRLVTHLNAEAFENYFDHFTDENTLTEEAKSFQLLKKALLEKFSKKKKEAVNLMYNGEDVEEFFLRSSKLYKEANFNEGTKHGMIMEAIKSDQSLLQFVSLRKVSTFDGVKDTCLGYAEHQKMYSLPKGVTTKPSGVFELEHLSSHQMNRYFRSYGGYPKVQRYCEKGSRPYIDRRYHYPIGVFLDVAHCPGHEEGRKSKVLYRLQKVKCRDETGQMAITVDR